jgi:hypothetical protein
MKLKEYAKHLAKLAKQHPDIDVYYAIDEEGNDYKPIYYHPSVGCLDGDDFESASNNDFRGPINACCVN